MFQEEIIHTSSSTNPNNSSIISQISEGSIIPESVFEVSSRSIPKFQGAPRQEGLIQEEETERGDIILSILWKAGKLGAAYFNCGDSELNIITDIMDLSPDFILMKTLFNQIKPTDTITIGSVSSKFVCTLASTILNALDESEITGNTSGSLKDLPANLQLLRNEEYGFEVCKHAVQTLQLPSEPAGATEAERLMYINSRLNFERRVSIHALGALLLFLNKFKGVVKPGETNNKLYLALNIVPIQNSVLIDEDTFQNLQVFNSTSHPSSFLRGKDASNKEGLSIFKLFDKCKSFLGRNCLRSMLLQPTNNIKILKNRLEFIEFCFKPINNGIIISIKDCLKSICSLTSILQKIHGNQAQLSHWRKLYSTLHNIMLIQQMVFPYKSEVQIFRNFVEEVDDIIPVIMNTINSTIDFENSQNNMVVIRNGVDEELDSKKRYRFEIRDKLTMAATCEIQNLPNFIQICSIAYIPQIGYLLVVKKWTETADCKDLENLGFRFMFIIGDFFYYKSSVCDELDKCLGDIYTQIQEHEAKLILRLSQHIITHSLALKLPLKMAAYFDSLICIAEVAKDLGYTRPALTEENVIKIKDGRHPLLDIRVSNFVPNSILSGGDASVLKILTGPNNSGKSIYLKQTALIVYLAHIGSYVPAKSATVGMLASIHFCTSSNITESVTVRMSTFAVDLRLISQALNCSKRNSLILIDEFGRATTELDGLALLTSYLEHFLLREEYCPHILVSTHNLQITNLIPESKLVEHYKCNHKLVENKLIFLYNIEKGVSKSYAKYAAGAAGISADIITRSEEILKYFTDGTPITGWKNN